MGRALLVAPLLALALFIIVIPLTPTEYLIAVTPVYAGTPGFKVKEAYTDKAAYYIGESVTLYVVLAWENLGQNYTLDIDLYETVNDTKVQDLGTLTVPGTTYEATDETELTFDSLTGLTAEPGSTEYEIRVVDTGSGLLVASAKLTITVAEESITLSVAWEDANDDRVIEPNEQVTFTVFITWAFVNASRSYNLFVDDAGEHLIDAVSITAGGGTAQRTWVTAWPSAGARTLRFMLKDARGDVVAERSLSLTVGQAAQPAQPSKASILDLIKANIYLIIIVLACVGAAVVVAKYR